MCAGAHLHGDWRLVIVFTTAVMQIDRNMPATIYITYRIGKRQRMVAINERDFADISPAVTRAQQPNENSFRPYPDPDPDLKLFIKDPYLLILNFNYIKS